MKDFYHYTSHIDESGLIFKNKTKSANEASIKAITTKLKNSYPSVGNTNNPLTVLYQNTPISRVTITKCNAHIMFMGYMNWQLKDPRGFSIYVYPSVIGYILENCTIINGVIQEELLYHIPYKYTDLEVLINKHGQWLDSYKKQWII